MTHGKAIDEPNMQRCNEPTERRTARRAISLSDGRELIYFDEAPGIERTADDERGLDRARPASEVRWDPLFEDVAVIAGHRQARTFQPSDADCPLCPSRGGRRTEIPAAEYEVVVFENRFPAFSDAATAGQVGSGAFPTTPGGGRAEVLCFTSEHDVSLSELPPARVRTVIDAWCDRTEFLAARDDIAYVACFENRGTEIGVTLSHAHGQIYGYPFVPPRFERATRAARRHRLRTGECLQCVQLRDEISAGARIVAEYRGWVAYVPFAARWPYEVRLVPARHVGCLPELSGTERDALALAYLDVLKRFDLLFDVPAPYIAAWLQCPPGDDCDSWHVAAEIFTIRRAADRIKYLAGAESSAATWINDIRPESAAAQLRAVRD